ncbi:MAG: FAD-binding oxidoreductase [bacterium]|nr:FAD-binding oxidoreductase [bacterium]
MSHSPTSQPISGWGRYPVVEGVERLSEDLERITERAAMTRGLGRSYGDASLPPAPGRAVAGSRLADRILRFDETTGVLRAEAGLSLGRLSRTFLPRGFASPVFPGTQFVTLGGMVASDVHGKNHHVNGCFGEHVRALRMRVADGRVIEVSADCHSELFLATIGGMGLTGHILEVELQLEKIPSPWILSRQESCRNLNELIERLGAASASWPFTVAWVDSLRRGTDMGRGVVISGRWAQPAEVPTPPPRSPRRLAVPFDTPSWLLGPWSMRWFNRAYYHINSRRGTRRVVHPESFFHPLDAVADWNRLYGRAGFVQYQCVIPREADRRVHRSFFECLTRLGGASFLSVIKDCGETGRGILSFPMPGISIALDIPMRGDATRELVDRLNEIVIGARGRIYLAKDALTRPEHFRAMDPRLDAWNAVRRTWDPDGRIATALSVRMFGDRA